jgi:hypothetical protein
LIYLTLLNRYSPSCPYLPSTLTIAPLLSCPQFNPSNSTRPLSTSSVQPPLQVRCHHSERSFHVSSTPTSSRATFRNRCLSRNSASRSFSYTSHLVPRLASFPYALDIDSHPLQFCPPSDFVHSPGATHHASTQIFLFAPKPFLLDPMVAALSILELFQLIVTGSRFVDSFTDSKDLS